jgi:preprotein translocase subunit SecE
MAKTTTDKPTTTKQPARPPATSRTAVVTSAGGRLPRFLREVRIEMGKVTWPSRAELIQSTTVVVIAVLIAAAYIGVLDLVWSSLVKLVRLGG